MEIVQLFLSLYLLEIHPIKILSPKTFSQLAGFHHNQFYEHNCIDIIGNTWIRIVTWWTKSNWGGKSSGASACFCFSWAWYWASSSASLSNDKSHILHSQAKIPQYLIIFNPCLTFTQIYDKKKCQVPEHTLAYSAKYPQHHPVVLYFRLKSKIPALQKPQRHQFLHS